MDSNSKRIAIVALTSVFALLCVYVLAVFPQGGKRAREGALGGHGRMTPEEIRKLLKRAGGEIIPLPKNRFFLQWFPDDWSSLDDKRIVISLHGSGGHAERMFNLWHRTRRFHDYAIIAVQYAESDSEGHLQFDDTPTIYKNLRIVLDKLKKTFQIQNAPVVLHGFSKGSARVFEIAGLDRAPEGMRAFAAFIADSGTVFPENKGALSPRLKGLAGNGYHGARFWLYCGLKDHNGRTCVGMRKMARFVINQTN